jgi:hypothetical protein
MRAGPGLERAFDQQRLARIAFSSEGASWPSTIMVRASSLETALGLSVG